jgi:hypothetical protein
MTPTERAHVWQQHITDWQAAGVSGSAYCKRQSLIYHQFVYWRRKLISTEDSLKQEQEQEQELWLRADSDLQFVRWYVQCVRECWLESSNSCCAVTVFS